LYIGHYAVAFAAKRAAPKTSLGVLLAAALFVDLLWPIFLLLGWERVKIEPGNTAFTPLAFVYYPITHSLLTGVGWAAVAGLIYYGLTRYRAGAIAVAVLVLSHWLLDFVVHRPDLPLAPGGSKLLGLGLWNSIAGTLVVEGILFVFGVWIYLVTTRAKDNIGRYGLLLFLILNLLIYMSGLVGPPPPNETVLAWVALGVWLFPLWAGWIDRHRAVVRGDVTWPETARSRRR
jgi:hypothetical protein